MILDVLGGIGMDLHEIILCDTIARQVIPSLRIDPAALVEMRCYQTIRRIYEIVSNEALNDALIFERVEELVSALDDLGIGGGGCHDFG